MPSQKRNERESGTALRAITRGDLLALVAIALMLASFLFLMVFYTITPSFTVAGVCTPTGNVIAIHHQTSGVVTEVLVNANDYVEAGAPLLRICPNDRRGENMTLQEMRDASVVVAAEQSGFVSEIAVSEWEETSLSTTLLYLSQSDKKEIVRATVMVPAANLDMISVGSPVTLAVDGLPVEKFGTVRGEVCEISKVPWSREDLFRRVGSHQVADTLFSDEMPLFHVEIVLEDSNGDGIPNFGKGEMPANPVICWRMCQATLYSDDIHPYQFLFSSGG